MARGARLQRKWIEARSWRSEGERRGSMRWSLTSPASTFRQCVALMWRRWWSPSAASEEDNYLTHKHRLAACELAEAKLRKAKITSSDVLQVVRQWSFQSNSRRGNVIPEGKAWVFSDTFGMIVSRSESGGVESMLCGQYPAMLCLFSRWLRDSRDGMPFPFTSVNLNFDYAARVHRDRRNAGPSMLRALGNFKGGELAYYPDDDGTLPLAELPHHGKTISDVSKKFKLFDGNRAHAVEAFQGERFSVVFYTSGGYDRCAPSVRAALMKSGVQWPTKKALDYFRGFLNAPRGYTMASTGKKRRRDDVKPVEVPQAPSKTVPRFRVRQHPHLHLNLEVGHTYSVSSLLKKCRGDAAKAMALRRKLADPSVFEPLQDEN